MAITRHTIPPFLNQVRNLITYEVSSDIPAASGTLSIQCAITIFRGATIIADLQLEKKVETHQIISFNINDILRSTVLRADISDAAGLSLVDKASLAKVSFSDWISGVPQSGVNPDSIFFIRGGKSFIGERQNNLPDVNGAGVVFLTTRPDKRYVYQEQKEYLYLVARDEVIDFELTFTLFYTDGTSAAVIRQYNTTLSRHGTYKIDLSYDSNGFAAEDPTKELASFSVQDTAGRTLSYIYRSNTNSYFRQFFYENSLGGRDSLVCTGQSKSNYTHANDLIQRPVSEASTVYEGTISQYNVTVEEEINVSTGYFKTKDEAMAFIDFLHAETIHEYTDLGIDADETFYPIVLISSSYPIQDGDNMWVAQFTYRYAWQDMTKDPVR